LPLFIDLAKVRLIVVVFDIFNRFVALFLT